MNLLKVICLTFLLIIISIALYSYNGQRNYTSLEGLCSKYMIQLDSLKAENKLLEKKISYLLEHFNTKEQIIPEPKGMKFIIDSITNSKPKK